MSFASNSYHSFVERGDATLLTPPPPTNKEKVEHLTFRTRHFSVWPAPQGLGLFRRVLCFYVPATLQPFMHVRARSPVRLRMNGHALGTGGVPQGPLRRELQRAPPPADHGGARRKRPFPGQVRGSTKQYERPRLCLDIFFPRYLYGGEILLV